MYSRSSWATTISKILLSNDPTFHEPSVVYTAVHGTLLRYEVWVVCWRALIGQMACNRLAVTEL